MANLPEERVEPSPPFIYCGFDCFCPFIVKDGRKELKRFGLLFTYMSSRAAHIEMLDDMTTDAFINALRCFIALHGTVRLVRSDQGTNFIGAQHELARAFKEINETSVQVFLETHGCDFVLNVPSYETKKHSRGRCSTLEGRGPCAKPLEVGRVVETMPSKDNLVRKVRLLVADVRIPLLTPLVTKLNDCWIVTVFNL